jgi:hypothetical protein
MKNLKFLFCLMMSHLVIMLLFATACHAQNIVVWKIGEKDAKRTDLHWLPIIMKNF